MYAVLSCFPCILIFEYWSLLLRVFVFFFKQKTAYEMRISDWSSDVCSSDLTTRSIGGILCSAIAAACSALSRTASSPPCTLGCSVSTQIGRASCRERVCQYV